jgi:hypothetical protein
MTEQQFNVTFALIVGVIVIFVGLVGSVHDRGDCLAYSAPKVHHYFIGDTEIGTPKTFATCLQWENK